MNLTARKAPENPFAIAIMQRIGPIGSKINENLSKKNPNIILTKLDKSFPKAFSFVGSS